MSIRGIFELLEGRQLLAAHIGPTSYATIQAAVDAAKPGAVITVDAGEYDELVTVNKSVTLKGAQAGVDATNSARGTAKSVGESVLDGQDFGGGNRSTSIYITANDVTIDGFTVQDDSSSNQYGAGIVIAPSVSGTHIQNNIVQANISGLYLANDSATDRCVIQDNLFANNNNEGTNSGRGIYTDGGVSGGKLTGVVIDGNTFSDNVGFDGDNYESGIGLEAQTAGEQSNITITNNIMSANGKGVLMYNVSNVMIQGNTMTGSKDTGSGAIRVEGGSDHVTIDKNTFSGNLGAGVRITDRFTGPNSAITVNQNNFVGNAAGGLYVDAGGYTGTLDATGNFWGSAQGPSGIGTGPGDAITAPDGNVTFSPWSDTQIDIGGATNPQPPGHPTPTPPQPHQPPGKPQPPGHPQPTPPPSVGSLRGLLTAIIDDLSTLRSKVGGALKHKLDDAITNLKAALDPSLWQDDSHLAAGAGQTVFKLCEKAFVQLRSLRHHGKGHGLPDGVTPTMERIMDLEQSLALLSVTNAAGGNAKDLTHANHDLWAAIKAIGNGDALGAMDQLTATWNDAGKASKPAPPAAPVPAAPAPASNDDRTKKKGDGDDDGQGDGGQGD